MTHFRTLFVIALSLLILGSAALAGQAGSAIDKGSQIVGGGAAFSSLGGDLYESGSGDRVTLVLFAPEFGTFVAPHMAISAQLLVGHLSQGDNDLYALGIGPRLRYYFGDTKSNGTLKRTTYPYLTAGFLWGQVNDADSDKHTLTAFTLGGGLAYMISNSVALTAELNYRADKLDWANSDAESGSSINMMAGFTMFLWE